MNETMDSTDALLQRIHILQAEMPLGQRLIVGIAGAPGSGKSTLAQEICQRLNEEAALCRSPDSQAEHREPNHLGKNALQAVVVPMDGFHLDNCILEERGLIDVKGSPQTFDVDGFVSHLQRLVESQGNAVYFPVFDRHRDLARNAALCVDDRHGVVIVEGNYLFLARPGWERLAALFHLNIMLDVPMELLQERLVQRWLDHGFDSEQALTRAMSNDIPNAELVIRESKGSHVIYESVRQ